MPTPRPTPFTAYEFSEEEILQANVLPPLLRQRIQTMLADTSVQVLGLVYDPDKPLDFVQKDAALKGQMQVYQLLLEEDLIAQNTLVKKSLGNQAS